jgi:nicotinamidase-related amidase
MKNSPLVFCSVCFLGLLLCMSSAYGAPPDKGPRTLLQMSGVKAQAPRLSESVLLIIDAQREYVDGKLRLNGIDASLKEASILLQRARKAGIPIIHVVHKSTPGSSLFDPNGPYVEIAAPVAARPGETIITKTMPNSFSGTNLEETLAKTERKNIIVIGYMTHMCVSTTVRAALDRGYHATVVAKATATRDLPDSRSGMIPAQTIQRASLAALADRFAVIVQRAKDIPE